MVSSIFGMGIIALPSGIITAGFLQEMNKLEDSKSEPENLESKEEL